MGTGDIFHAYSPLLLIKWGLSQGLFQVQFFCFLQQANLIDPSLQKMTLWSPKSKGLFSPDYTGEKENNIFPEHMG